MEKVYIVKGIDCANCAREFEEKVSKIDGVQKVVVNFMSEKLIVESEIDCEKDILKVAENFEDGLKLKRIK